MAVRFKNVTTLVYMVKYLCVPERPYYTKYILLFLGTPCLGRPAKTHRTVGSSAFPNRIGRTSAT